MCYDWYVQDKYDLEQVFDVRILQEFFACSQFFNKVFHISWMQLFLAFNKSGECEQ